MSAPSSTPSIAELRAATQPASIFARNSGEHWAGRLYVRRLSPYVTRALIPTRVSPNAVTWAMTVVGVLAAAVLTLPGVWAAAAALVLIQLQILLDCSDGELARWRRQYSTAGIYLDRFAHYLTETALPIGARHPRRRRLGRDRHVHDARPARRRARAAWCGWRARSSTSRARRPASRPSPTPPRSPRRGPPASGACAAGSASSRSSARSWPSRRRCSRFAAALLDLALGDLEATRVLVVALVPVAAITAAGHLLAILTSERLR